MSILSFLFETTVEQEETNNSYQAWRNENPDNLSDDDFYDDDSDNQSDNQDDSEPQNTNSFLGWLGL